VGDVVAAVPGVESGGFSEGLAAVFRMNITTLPLIALQGSEKQDPAGVQAFENLKRKIDGSGPSIGKIGPELLVVRFDGGPVLGEGEAHADVRVHMAVGEMVNQLADGPAALSVRGIELSVAQAVDGGAQVFRQRGDGGDVRGVIGEIGFSAAESADRVARVGLSRWGGGCGGGGAHTRKVHCGRKSGQGGSCGQPADQAQSTGTAEARDTLAAWVGWDQAGLWFGVPLWVR